MNDELFQQLAASLKEGGALLHGSRKPARETTLTVDERAERQWGQSTRIHISNGKMKNQPSGHPRFTIIHPRANHARFIRMRFRRWGGGRRAE